MWKSRSLMVTIISSSAGLETDQQRRTLSCVDVKSSILLFPIHSASKVAFWKYALLLLPIRTTAPLNPT